MLAILLNIRMQGNVTSLHPLTLFGRLASNLSYNITSESYNSPKSQIEVTRKKKMITN